RWCMMDTLWYAVWRGIQTDVADLPGTAAVTQSVVRLVLAALLGGLVGFQWERSGKAAGLRTPMLVALGAAFFVVIPAQAGMPLPDRSRCLQGIIPGVGFPGAGTIRKRPAPEEIEGLTTAAGLWLTAAVGSAAGMGRETSAVLGAVLAFIILSLL